MSEKIVTLTTLPLTSMSRFGRPRPGGLLGGVVWPVQNDLPGAGGDRRGAGGKIQIGKLNIDDNLDVTRRFDVMSIPTLILFKDGEPEGTPDRGEAQGPAAPRDLGLPVGLPRSSPSGTGASGLRHPAAADRHRLGGARPSTPTAVFGPAPVPPSRPSSACAASGSTASAAPRPGTPWSRPVFGWVTASSTAALPCCGATTWPSCSSACARWASTRAGSTGSSATAPQRAWPTSSATPAPVDGIVGGATLRELHANGEPPPRARARLERARPGPAARVPAHPRRPPRGHRREWRPGQRHRSPSGGGLLGVASGHELHHPDDSTQAKRGQRARRGRCLRRAPAQSGRVGVPHLLLVRLPTTSPQGGRWLAELVQRPCPGARHRGRRRARHVGAHCCARPACLQSWSRSGRPAGWSSGPALAALARRSGPILWE
jgi:hypothetical protein